MSSGLILTGRIKSIFDEKRVNDKFNVREFVLTIQEDTPYPQDILLHLFNNNCDFIIGKHVGDKVECRINIKGKEYITKEGKKGYNNTIECFRIYKEEAQ